MITDSESQPENKVKNTARQTNQLIGGYFMPNKSGNVFEHAQYLLRQNTVKPPRETIPC